MTKAVMVYPRFVDPQIDRSRLRFLPSEFDSMRIALLAVVGIAFLSLACTSASQADGFHDKGRREAYRTLVCRGVRWSVGIDPKSAGPLATLDDADFTLPAP